MHLRCDNFSDFFNLYTFLNLTQNLSFRRVSGGIRNGGWPFHECRDTITIFGLSLAAVDLEHSHFKPVSMEEVLQWLRKATEMDNLQIFHFDKPKFNRKKTKGWMRVQVNCELTPDLLSKIQSTPFRKNSIIPTGPRDSNLEYCYQCQNYGHSKDSCPDHIAVRWVLHTANPLSKTELESITSQIGASEIFLGLPNRPGPRSNRLLSVTYKNETTFENSVKLLKKFIRERCVDQYHVRTSFKSFCICGFPSRGSCRTNFCPDRSIWFKKDGTIGAASVRSQPKKAAKVAEEVGESVVEIVDKRSYAAVAENVTRKVAGTLGEREA